MKPNAGVMCLCVKAPPPTVTTPRAVAQCVVSYLDGLGVDAHGNYGVHDNIAVRSAASKGHLDVVRYLCELPVDRGVDPSANDNCAVRWASKEGRLDVVRYLCELPADRGVDWSAVRWEEAHPVVARYMYYAYGCARKSPFVSIAKAGQQALRSCARSPLLMVAALLRQQRAIPLRRISAAPSGRLAPPRSAQCVFHQ